MIDMTPETRTMPDGTVAYFYSPQQIDHIRLQKITQQHMQTRPRRQGVSSLLNETAYKSAKKGTGADTI